MTFIIADRVKETTTTTGTGTITLNGAVTQFQSFGAVGNTNQCNYTILSGNGTGWEVGVGTYTTSGTTLSRPAANVTAGSSGAGTLISLTGTSTVFLTEPAVALKSLRAAPIVAPTAAANWTQVNFGGTTTVTDVANGVALFDSSSSGQNGNLRGITIASPTAPYTIDVNLCAIGAASSAGTSYLAMGIGWTDTTKIQALVYQLEFDFGGGCYLYTNNYSNSSTYASSVGTQAYGNYNMADLWFRIADDSTNVSCAASTDGVTFITLYTVAKSSGYLGSSGYTNVGLFLAGGLFCSGGSGSVTIRSWYKH